MAEAGDIMAVAATMAAEADTTGEVTAAEVWRLASTGIATAHNVRRDTRITTPAGTIPQVATYPAETTTTTSAAIRVGTKPDTFTTTIGERTSLPNKTSHVTALLTWLFRFQEPLVSQAAKLGTI